MRGLSLREGLGRKSRALSGHQSWALLCRYRCRLLLAEVPKGVDRNSELKQRLHFWEMGRSDWQGPGSAELRAAAQNNREDVAVDGRTAWEASLCFDSWRLHQQSHEGLVGGSADCRRNWTIGHGTHPTSAECVEAGRSAWSGGRDKLSRSAMRE